MKIVDDNSIKRGFGLILIAAVMLVGSGCSTTYTVARGAFQGELGNCPSSPNCVSSNAEDEDQYYDPIRFKGEPDQAMTHLKGVLAQYPRTAITQQQPNYLRVEFKTALFGFVDDAEFLIVGDKILVRSASREGYSDFGKNRRRMREIQEAFEPCC